MIIFKGDFGRLFYLCRLKSLKYSRILVVASIIFVLWMLFLDPNNLWRQIKQKQKVNEEREKVEFYKQNIEELSKKSKKHV